MGIQLLLHMVYRKYTATVTGGMGEYIGKIYMETKHRPRYHIEAYLWKDGQEKEE